MYSPSHSPSLTTRFLHALPPEIAHNLAIRALSLKGNLPNKALLDGKRADSPLFCQFCGMDFSNPVGLAAGFDKNAEAIAGAFGLGFGFVEVGTITPRPQKGNPTPRLFRLKEDDALINRMGFNNHGMEKAVRNLEKFRLRFPSPPGPVGVNIGKNKETENALEDYVLCTRRLSFLADYITLNVSSPNTPGLRTLQASEALLPIVEAVADILAQNHKDPPPLFVKIAPDLKDREIDAMAEFALKAPIQGLIISNTTLSRNQELRSVFKQETGGLSGTPLRTLSTSLLTEMARRLNHKIPLIGVGGISSADHVYEKLSAGAGLVQIYSGLVLRGDQLIRYILDQMSLAQN